MTKWEIVVLCFGMVLLILATTAHAAETASAPSRGAIAERLVPCDAMLSGIEAIRPGL